MFVDFWQYLLTGAGGAVIIGSLISFIKWIGKLFSGKLNEEIRKDVELCKTATRLMLLVHFQNICKEKLEEQVITLQDYQQLIDMYDSYKSLGGDGYADMLKEQLDSLPKVI